MSLLQHAALAVVIFALLWWLTGFAVAGAYRLLRRPLDTLQPETRTRALTGIAVLPALLAGAVTLALYLPVARELTVSAHCHAGIGCGAHAPALNDGPARWLIDALAALVVTAAIWRITLPLLRHDRRARQLAALSSPTRDGQFRVVETDQPVALAVGLWRPRVFVSRGMLAQLAPQALSSVLLHEEAHARRRDALRQLLAAIAGPALLSGPGRALMHDLHVACEQSCDRAAARAEADPLRVADALLRARRAAHTAAPDAGGRPDGALHARIAALIGPPPPPALLPMPLALLGLGIAALLTMLWGIDAVHHGAELLQRLSGPSG